MKKRRTGSKRQIKSDIRPDILAAIRKAYPNKVLEMTWDPDGSYFDRIYPRLKARLAKLKEAHLVYERQPEEPPDWGDSDDESGDPPMGDDQINSYHLFFLGMVDQRFKFEVETELIDEDEDDEFHTGCGVGQLGCTIGVSLVAPFAVVALDEIEQFENGSQAVPDVFPHIFPVGSQTATDSPVDGYLREMLADEDLHFLHDFRDKIARLLESFNLTVNPDEEARKFVPWLKADEEVFAGNPSTRRGLTVLDAFFFKSL